MSQRNPLVIANWKMNTTLSDAMVLASTIKNGFENIDHVEGVLAPPAVWLYPIHEKISNFSLDRFSLAVQNIHHETEGAYTGEISVDMVKNMVRYVLVGHSERANFGETTPIVNKKIQLALKNNLRPVIFVGERQKNTPISELVDDLEQLLKGVDKSEYGNLEVVYEPVWAISSKKGSEPAGADEVEKVTDAFKQAIGDQTRVLYGGSVNKDNCIEYLQIDSVDGVIVGSDSLKASHFIEIAKQTARYGTKNIS